jgi:hypothetical protein
MKCRLQQSRSRKATLARVVHDGLHQHPSDAPVLNVWIDRYRPDTGYCRALVKAVASNNATIEFRDYTESYVAG